ncbi:Hpt domain-containing protein [Aquisphaera giovannonii]|uniref:Hpt domain-containing protein n=1 Tax=Aquisphaera giovannonii TaxID=406548 RepID=UPI00143D067B|nr:Hpt domain-containing protein [Aquisphaera giovannonii]
MSDANSDMFREMFFEEARELLETLDSGLSGDGPPGDSPKRWDPVYRAAHSLKGAAAMVGLAGISQQALAMEKALGQLRTGAAAWGAEISQSLGGQRARLVELIDDEEKRFRAP